MSSPWVLREWTDIWPDPGLTETWKELKHNKEKVDELWKKSRHFDSDFLPVQVKTLAIWTALCERYHPKVCVIGHRSGFIESAGLIGIPIFYLNNERLIIDKEHKASTSVGDLLWRPAKDPTTNRLRELADVMNTFIPIEALERKKLAVNEVLRVDPKYEKELAAALFMYMCCERPVRVRMGPKAKNDLEFQLMPVWMARVEMMHTADEGNQYEADQNKDSQPYRDFMHPKPRTASQMGQDWLSSTYYITDYVLRSWEAIKQDRRKLHGWGSLDRRSIAERVRSLTSKMIKKSPRNMKEDGVSGGRK